MLCNYPPDLKKEACAFRDQKAGIDKAKAVIVGISRDSISSHERFLKKYGLPFLLSDTEEKLCKEFDVIKEKSLYGKKYMGIERSTFLINPDGIIKRKWRGVNLDGHAEAALSALREEIG